MLDAAIFLGSARGLHRIARPGAADEHRLLSVCRACFDEAGIDRLLGSHVHFAEHAADFRGERLALFGLQIEDRDLDALDGKRARGGGTEAGGAAGDDGRGG